MAGTEAPPGFSIGDMAVPLPLVQGGMAVGISLAELAAAVAEAGGIGVIAATGIGMGEKDFERNPLGAHIRVLRRELRKARSLTRGIIGVNVMMVSNDCFELMRTAKQEGADVIFMGAGLPVKIPEEFFETYAQSHGNKTGGSGQRGSAKSRGGETGRADRERVTAGRADRKRATAGGADRERVIARGAQSHGAGFGTSEPSAAQQRDAAPPKTSPKLVPILSSAKAVRFVLSHWEREYKRIPDAFVIEGPLAGGHLGFRRQVLQNSPPALERILAEVLGVVREWEKGLHTRIPVICGGGIFDGRDMKRILSRGAAAVQMATRFAAAAESAAAPEFKKAYVECAENDIMLIDSPVGMPGRAIGNSFLREAERGRKKPFRCVWRCIKTCDVERAPYCIAECMMNAKLGRLDRGFVFCGANAYRVNEILPVREIIRNLKSEYGKAEA
jgi:NAD(P)H-dependent flavin oxidoreductase YrpB (nitropropane dioxygenase family)